MTDRLSIHSTASAGPTDAVHQSGRLAGQTAEMAEGTERGRGRTAMPQLSTMFSNALQRVRSATSKPQLTLAEVAQRDTRRLDAAADRMAARAAKGTLTLNDFTALMRTTRTLHHTQRRINGEAPNPTARQLNQIEQKVGVEAREKLEAAIKRLPDPQKEAALVKLIDYRPGQRGLAALDTSINSRLRSEGTKANIASKVGINTGFDRRQAQATYANVLQVAKMTGYSARDMLAPLVSSKLADAAVTGGLDRSSLNILSNLANSSDARHRVTRSVDEAFRQTARAEGRPAGQTEAGLAQFARGGALSTAMRADLGDDEAIVGIVENTAKPYAIRTQAKAFIENLADGRMDLRTLEPLKSVLESPDDFKSAALALTNAAREKGIDESSLARILSDFAPGGGLEGVVEADTARDPELKAFMTALTTPFAIDAQLRDVSADLAKGVLDHAAFESLLALAGDGGPRVIFDHLTDDMKKQFAQLGPDGEQAKLRDVALVDSPAARDFATALGAIAQRHEELENPGQKLVDGTLSGPATTILCDFASADLSLESVDFLHAVHAYKAAPPEAKLEMLHAINERFVNVEADPLGFGVGEVGINVRSDNRVAFNTALAALEGTEGVPSDDILNGLSTEVQGLFKGEKTDAMKESDAAKAYIYEGTVPPQSAVVFWADNRG